jgi:hypothetical protein
MRQYFSVTLRFFYVFVLLRFQFYEKIFVITTKYYSFFWIPILFSLWCYPFCILCNYFECEMRTFIFYCSLNGCSASAPSLKQLNVTFPDILFVCVCWSSPTAAAYLHCSVSVSCVPDMMYDQYIHSRPIFFIFFIQQRLYIWRYKRLLPLASS